MPWIGKAPCFLVFLANGRRLPALSRLRGKTVRQRPFRSAVQRRDRCRDGACRPASPRRKPSGSAPARSASSATTPPGSANCSALPERVIPLAGLCIGWPSDQGRLSPRLPLAMTLHRDRYDESGWAEQLDAYDRRREAMAPYREQRDPGVSGSPRIMAGRRTRPGNMRCRSGPISALMCAAAGFSTD